MAAGATAYAHQSSYQQTPADLTTTNGVDYYDGKSYSFSSKRVGTKSGMGNNDTYRLMLQSSNNLTYTGSWNDHHLTATAVYEVTSSETRTMGITGNNLLTEGVGWWNVGMASSRDANNGYEQWALMSGVARVMYNFKDRYMLTGTFRADGSSRFAKKKWGYFPSIAAAWTLSNEDFMKDVSSVQDIKLRASYGIVGSQAISPYATMGLMSATAYNFGTNSNFTGYWANDIATPELTWEKTKQFDIGLDMAFFNNRLRVAADYYSKKSEDLLFDVSLPDTSGYGSAMQNVGSIRFYGLEFEISSVNVSTKNFSWTTDFTYSFNANKVLSLPDEYYYKDIDGKDAWRIGGYTMSESGYRFGGTAVGEPLGRIYGYKTSHIIESEAQADAVLYDSNSHGYRRSDGLSIAGRKDVGDYEWKNRAGSALTADGREQINGEDMFLLGNVVPHSTGGMNNTFKFKNLTLSVYLDYALGHSIYNYQYTRCFQTSMGNCNWNLVYDALNTWQKPGDDTKFARLTPNDADGGNRNYSRISNINVQKADYLCLRDVTLSYDLPLRWIRKVGLGRLTVSVSGNTLCYWTGVKGISPESASVGSSTGMYSVTSSSATSFNNYPPTRKVLFGLKATF